MWHLSGEAAPGPGVRPIGESGGQRRALQPREGRQRDAHGQDPRPGGEHPRDRDAGRGAARGGAEEEPGHRAEARAGEAAGDRELHHSAAGTDRNIQS